MNTVVPMPAVAPVPFREDWIDRFMAYTDRLPSPPILRLWSAIACIAGGLERRVWVTTAGGICYPNLYTLLVAPPAIGKSQTINKVHDQWMGTKKLYIAPKSVTKASLLDNLAKATRKLVIKDGQGLFEYNSLCIASSEFGVLVPEHDTEFMSVLVDIYDNPPDFREDRRTSRSVEIIKPQLNILAGTQPGFLANLLPEEAWSMGFMSRIIMIYAAAGPQIDLWDTSAEESPMRIELMKDLTRLTTLMGAVIFSDEAKAELLRWYKAGLPPVPEHSKLEYYNGRRLLHMLKLCMISATSRSAELVVEMQDLARARDWLLGAEQLMPDVFRDMVQRSDSVVLQELHFFMWRLWVKDKKAIHESRLIYFLQNRVPGEKVLRLLDIAERSNIIEREAGTKSYKPRPKHEHGME